MTDKQIIIDGVDVSECDYFYNQECRCMCDCMDLQKGEPIAQLFARKIRAEQKYCKQNPTCYFKELERKEQECENRKEAMAMLYNTLDNLLKSLIQVCKEHIDSAIPDDWENEEIVADISDYIKSLKDKTLQLKAENERLKELQKLLEEQMEFNKNELELSLSSEIKRSEFLLNEFKKIDKQRDNWREEAEKYYKTLNEIEKKITEDCNRHCPFEEINNDCDCVSKQILDIINEAKEENNAR